MRIRVEKWRNGLGVRIPISIVQQSQLKQGSMVNIEFAEGQIIISKEILSLETLLLEITPGNKHGEALGGIASGAEEW